MDTITTQRLILRPFLATDLDDVFEYCSSPNVGPNAGWKPHESIEESRIILHNLFMRTDGILAIVEKFSGKVIGSIGLVADTKRQNSKARMLGYALSENYWGKGYTTEAADAIIAYGFNNLYLDLISVYCYPFNYRSHRVIEKCGFKFDGVQLQAEKLYDGHIYDNLCFSLTKEEYRYLNQ